MTHRLHAPTLAGSLLAGLIVANASSAVSPGKNVIVWRRQGDGTLKTWRAISMYD